MSKFYDIAERLDQLKKNEVISSSEVDELITYFKEEKFVRYFFTDLVNPSWVLPLQQNGVFLITPPPLEDPNNPGYFSMPVWYAGEYLKRIADGFPNVVYEVALAFKTDNSRAIKTLLETLVKVPVDITAKITHKFRSWIETPFSNFMMLSHELGNIMEYLAKGGKVDAALTTLAILLEPIQVKDRFDDGKLVAGTRHDYYWLNQALQLNLPVLTKIDPIGVANIAEAQLVKAIELEHDPKIDDNVKKLNSYWRLSISPRSDVNYDNEIKNLLVNTIIAALNEACEQDIKDTSIILIRYIDSEYSIFRRTGNYILRAWGQKYPDLLERTCVRHKEGSIEGGESEFNRLLEIQFKNLPQSIQNEIIRERMTPDLQRVEELLKTNPERFVGETTEEKRQTIIERWQLEDLAPLASNLEEGDKEYYEYLQNKYGEPAPRPESGAVVTSWEGPESPIDVEELGKKSINEVIQYLLEYKPPTAESFGVPSREGLARMLETDVQNRANDYASNSALFVSGSVMPFVYHTHLLRGLQNATKNQMKIPLMGVVTLCEFITKQEKDNFQKQEFEEGLPAAKLAVAQLLEELFRIREPYIENDILEISGQIIANLLHQEEPFPDNEDAQGYDPATHSLNCIHGVAMHSLVSYGLYCERKRKKEMGNEGTPVMIPLVKDTLTEKLDKTKNPSLSVHSIFGWYFPQFVYLDKEWALENRERIFPTDTKMTKYWQVAWSAYIRFSDVYTNVFPELLKQYHKALEELSTPEKEKNSNRFDDKMATHILKAYLLDMIKLDSENGLLALYYQKTEDEVRSHGNFWLGQVLESQKPSAQDAIWQKIWNLWQWRIKTAATSDDKSKFVKEISDFSRLLKNAPIDILEIRYVLEESLKFKPNGFAIEEIIKYLGKNCENYPDLSMSILYEIIVANQIVYLLEETKDVVRNVLTVALKADTDSKNRAVEVINIFGERGDYSWRPLLDQATK